MGIDKISVGQEDNDETLDSIEVKPEFKELFELSNKILKRLLDLESSVKQGEELAKLCIGGTSYRDVYEFQHIKDSPVYFPGGHSLQENGTNSEISLSGQTGGGVRDFLILDYRKISQEVIVIKGNGGDYVVDASGRLSDHFDPEKLRKLLQYVDDNLQGFIVERYEPLKK